jgi:hypothetical protein
MQKHALEDEKFHAYVGELLGMDIPPKEFIHLFPLFTGWVNLARYLGLYELYKLTRGVLGHMAEIGTWKGSSFLFLAKLVRIFEPHSTTQVHGFDWFAGMKYDSVQDKTDHQGMYTADQATLERLVRMQGLENTAILHSMDVTKELAPFMEAHPSLQFKLVFLDCAAYQVVTKSLEALWPRVTPGGVIIFDHANNSELPQEQQAIRDFLGDVKLRTLDFCRTPTAYLVKE